MATLDPLETAAKNVITTCLGVKPGEIVTVVTDTVGQERVQLAQALCRAARAERAEAVFVEIAPRGAHGEEPPRAISALMASSDVVLCPTTKSLTHTQARRLASEHGARVATMPGITMETALRCLSADYKAIAHCTEALAKKLREGSHFRLKGEGTDLQLERRGREVFADTGLINASGMYGNLPAGEAFFSPYEGTADGVVVVGGAIAGVEHHGARVQLEIRNGIARVITNPEAAGASDEQLRKDRKAARALDEQLREKGEEAYKVAELGVGTNDRATITGSILEDEKVLGTVHVALGNNAGMGGTVSVQIHLDGVIKKATLYVDGVAVLEQGELRI